HPDLARQGTSTTPWHTERHGYTAISFAQQLARIDTQSIDSHSNAPIFSSLRNADLLLTHCRPQDKAGYGRFKVLEAS
ncbi:hypothetical protein, partial [Vibrio cholerae]|uniref:hypothetical protein n=1 Tax=Vibrio cholerae TaxID=666 RepID=UPI001F4609C4